jgi:DNA-directed RNA polymerase subunit E'/Rpb7
MTDPLFERRSLVRNVHIDSKFLQRNIQASLVAQLRMKYEGICVAEGYVQNRSITIVDHSLGRTNLIKGGLDYTVKFQADVCMPHQGQVFRMPVSLKSKLGIHAEMTPIKALLPRDLHIGVGEFDEVSDKEEIEFEVVGSRFQQGDNSIVVLGKLRRVIQPAVEGVSSATTVGEMEPMMAAPMSNEESAVRKVTVDVSSAKAADRAPRKRQVRLNPEANAKANEPSAQGTA